MSVETLPMIQVASLSRQDDRTILRLDDESRTSVAFELSDLALAMLGLTVRPALLAARDALHLKHPELRREGEVPDSPEGL